MCHKTGTDVMTDMAPPGCPSPWGDAHRGLEYKLLEGQDVFLSPCAIIPPLGNYLADIQRTSPLCREGMARNVCP